MNEEKNISNEEVEKIEVDEDLEIVKDVKNNETIMKEKVKDIIKDFEKDDIVYKKRNRRKTIFYSIGIIIEIIIIVLIIKSRYIKKSSDDSIKMSVKCSNTTQDVENNASVALTNTYYFNKENKVVKTEESVLYMFNDKDSYDRYKSDYISTDIKGFKGLNQQSIFDDNNYMFKNQTIYNYSELKENKNVTFKDNIYTLNVEGKNGPITIFVQDYDSVLDTNQSMNFICE